MTETLEMEVKRIFVFEVGHIEKGASPPFCAYFITPEKKYVADKFDFRDRMKARKLIKETAKKYKADIVIIVLMVLISQLDGTLIKPGYFRRKALLVYGETKRRNYGIYQELKRLNNGQIQIKNRVELSESFIGSFTGFLCRKYWV